MITSELKNDINEYLRMEQLIKSHNNTFKAIRERKKLLSTSINKDMIKKSVSELILHDDLGKLKAYTKKNKRRLTQMTIYKRCLLFYKGDVSKARYISEFICDKKHRGTDDVDTIKYKPNNNIVII